jgi:hypothetical protein
VTPVWFGPENWGWLALRGAIVALAFALEYSTAGLPIRQPLQWAFGLGVLAAALIYTTVLRRSAGN